MKEVRALRAYAEVALGRQRSPQHDTGPHMVPYLRAANVKDGVLDLSNVKAMNFDPKEQAQFALRPGDVLVTEGSGSLSAVGASAVWRGELPGVICFQNTLLRLRPRPTTDSRFLGWWCRYAFADGLFASIATGANIHHVSAERVRSLPMSYLQLAEQRAIADYLDTETARMDALIAKKRRMIELLDERRTTLIERATTLGLKPSVELKPAGVEFLDRIPGHWAITRLSVVCGFEPGKAHEPFVDQEGEYICVNSRFISTQGKAVKRCTQNLTPAQVDDILMVMSDLPNGRALARAYFVDRAGPYAVNQRVCRISPKQIHPRFAFYQLDRNARFLRHDDGSNQTHLPNSVFEKFSLLLPPESEQVEIADFLDRKTRSLDEGANSLARQIALLEERRRSVITAAVTGEFDVSKAA